STFYNRNHFATYAGLALITVVALTQELYHRALGSVPRGWRIQLATLIDISGGQGAALLTSAFLIAVALLLTGSRGGIIAAGPGLIVLGVLAHGGAGRRSRRSLVVTLFALIAVAAVLYAFGGFFAGSLEERGVSDVGRFSVFGLTLRSILDAPLAGFGYG